MALQTMYPGKVGSPVTTLSTTITSTATTISVQAGTALPDAPNLATIGSGENAEVIRYGTKVGGTLSNVTRGFQGTAQSHAAGTTVARFLTEYDLSSLQDNVSENNTEIVDARQSAVYGETFATLDGRLENVESKVGDRFPDNAGAHNSIYRGKYLGTSYTSAQQATVAAGTFEDLYIGDYWTIGGVNYRIAAFNYYRNTGDTLVPGNHITLVPDTVLYDAQMNPTNTTAGGYSGSEMVATGLDSARATIQGAFGSNLITMRRYLSNAVTGDEASGGAWFDSDIELMNEVMVYGTVANGKATLGLYNIGTEKSQLPLFALNPQSVNIRDTYWLLDVVYAAGFALVTADGIASFSGASGSFGVRPAFSIG